MCLLVHGPACSGFTQLSNTSALRSLMLSWKEILDSAAALPNWIWLIFNSWRWASLPTVSMFSLTLVFNSSPAFSQLFCFRSAWIELSKMLSVYLSSVLFQRAAEELFSPCVTTNGPFIMSSNSPSAGNIAWKQAQQFITTVTRSGFSFLVIILKSPHFQYLLGLLWDGAE